MLVQGAPTTEVVKAFPAARNCLRAGARGSRPLMGVHSAREIRQARWDKPNMNFMTSVVSGFASKETVLNHENDASHKNIGRQIFDFGNWRRYFAGFGLTWLSRVSARLDLEIRPQRFSCPGRMADSTRKLVDK